jgi:hypothetical protein
VQAGTPGRRCKIESETANEMSQMSQLLTDSDRHESQLVTGFFYEHEFAITQDVIGTYIQADKFTCSQQLQRNHRLREAIDIAYKKCEGKIKAREGLRERSAIFIAATIVINISIG